MPMAHSASLHRPALGPDLPVSAGVGSRRRVPRGRASASTSAAGDQLFAVARHGVGGIRTRASSRFRSPVTPSPVAVHAAVAFSCRVRHPTPPNHAWLCLTEVFLSYRIEGVEIRFTQTARKHRVGKASARRVMSGTAPTRTTTTQGNPAWRYVGRDERAANWRSSLSSSKATSRGPQSCWSSTSCRPAFEEGTQMPEHAPPVVTTDTPIGPDVDLAHEDIRLADGTTLTQQGADRIVAAARRSTGRPSLSGKAATSPHIAFRVAPDVWEHAAQVAAREGKTLSQLAREALEERLAASGLHPERHGQGTFPSARSCSAATQTPCSTGLSTASPIPVASVSGTTPARSGWASWVCEPPSGSSTTMTSPPAGDCNLRVEQIVVAQPDRVYPRCVGGAGPGPPEDWGGPWAFTERTQPHLVFASRARRRHSRRRPDRDP